MAGAVLSLTSLARPDAPDEDPMGVLLVGCAAALIGLVVWFLPWRSWPRPASLALLPVGFALIAVHNVVGGEDPYLHAVFYVVLFMWLGMAHPSGTALKTLPLFLIAYLAPIWATLDLDLTALISVVCIGLLCLLVGETLAFVSERWRASQSALLTLRGATDGLGEYLARASDSARLWQGGLEQVCSLLDVLNGDLYRLGDDGQLTCLASVADGEPYPEYLGVRAELELWAVDREAMETGKPALVTSRDDPRLSDEERDQMLEWGEHALLAIPLFSRDGVIGILELGEGREGRTITDEQAAVAISVCRLLAFSLHDAELVAAQQESNRKLTMLYEASRAVAGSAGIEQALDLIVHHGAKALGLSKSIAFEYDGEADAVVARASWERTPSGRDHLSEPLPLADRPAERRVLASGEPLLERLSDPQLDPESRAVMEQRGESMCLVIPMGSREGPMGLLAFGDDRQERSVSDADLALARSLADLAGEAILSSKLVRKLRLLSETDALTGLANHRKLREALKQEEARARRYKSPFAVVMIDVDGFKLLNDAYGHPAGDSVLTQMARLLEKQTRATDVVARYGGDEFLLLLPETTAAEAGALAEKLRRAVSEAPYVTKEGERIPLHMSIGIAGYPEDQTDVNALIATADANLYASKRRGGDAVTVCEEETHDGGGSGGIFTLCDSLVTAVDNKDAYTRRHSEEVTEYALVLGVALGLSDETLHVLRVAGLLHDIGKIGVPDRILRKPGRLDDAEYDVVKGHSDLGGMIISALPDLQEIRDAVVSHHERFDGCGYPHRLTGAEIPILGRVLAVADAYSAMTTDRPYRQALSHEEAVEELRSCAGSQFDPDLVEVFIAHIERVTPPV